MFVTFYDKSKYYYNGTSLSSIIILSGCHGQTMDYPASFKLNEYYFAKTKFKKYKYVR